MHPCFTTRELNEFTNNGNGERKSCWLAVNLPEHVIYIRFPRPKRAKAMKLCMYGNKSRRTGMKNAGNESDFRKKIPNGKAGECFGRGVNFLDTIFFPRVIASNFGTDLAFLWTEAMKRD